MRKYLLATLSVAALSFASQSSFAADVEMAPAAYDWSGPYLGVTAGYGWGDVTQYDGGGDSGNVDGLDGFIAGGTLGYNHQMGSFLIGLETDISYSDISSEFSDQPGWDCIVDDGCQTDVDWFGTARLRLGLPMDSFLPYITGGLAIGGVESRIEGNTDFTLDETELGWTVGGGVEAAVTESLTVKAEVLYVDFGRTDRVGPEDFAVSTDFIAARLGLNWQF